MFTGIIEAIGEVTRVDAPSDLRRIAVVAAQLCREVAAGDSIAVNGTCLTVTAVEADAICFDVIRESLDRTNLGELKPGSRVNLERAMLAGSRFDGHIVQGHVDCVGQVRRLERSGEDVQLFVDCPASFAEQLIEKGSVTIDGTALTIVRIEKDGFDVALIPYTLRETTLGDYEPGCTVNLEGDVLGKYVVRYLDRIQPARA